MATYKYYTIANDPNNFYITLTHTSTGNKRTLRKQTLQSRLETNDIVFEWEGDKLQIAATDITNLVGATPALRYNDLITTYFSSQAGNETYLLTVGEGGGYDTIQDALDHAATLSLSATQKCVVQILPGTYTEDLIVPPFTYLKDTEPDTVTVQSSTDTVLTFDNSGGTGPYYWYLYGINFTTTVSNNDATARPTIDLTDHTNTDDINIVTEKCTLTRTNAYSNKREGVMNVVTSDPIGTSLTMYECHVVESGIQAGAATANTHCAITFPYNFAAYNCEFNVLSDAVAGDPLSCFACNSAYNMSPSVYLYNCQYDTTAANSTVYGINFNQRNDGDLNLVGCYGNAAGNGANATCIRASSDIGGGTVRSNGSTYICDAGTSFDDGNGTMTISLNGDYVRANAMATLNPLVGSYFDENTNHVHINELQLINGVYIDEFSADPTLSGDSDLAVPTEHAVKTYVDALVPGGDKTFELTVGNGCEYATVNAAVTASGLMALSAAQRAVINIYPGTYTEVATLTIPNWVDIQGAGSRNEVIINNATAGTTIAYAANSQGSAIRTCTIRNTWGGGNISVINVSNCAGLRLNRISVEVMPADNLNAATMYGLYSAPGVASDVHADISTFKCEFIKSAANSSRAAYINANTTLHATSCEFVSNPINDPAAVILPTQDAGLYNDGGKVYSQINTYMSATSGVDTNIDLAVNEVGGTFVTDGDLFYILAGTPNRRVAIYNNGGDLYGTATQIQGIPGPGIADGYAIWSDSGDVDLVGVMMENVNNGIRTNNDEITIVGCYIHSKVADIVYAGPTELKGVYADGDGVTHTIEADSAANANTMRMDFDDVTAAPVVVHGDGTFNMSNAGNIGIIPSGGRVDITGNLHTSGDIEVHGNDLYVGDSTGNNTRFNDQNGTMIITPSGGGVQINGQFYALQDGEFRGNDVYIGDSTGTNVHLQSSNGDCYITPSGGDTLNNGNLITTGDVEVRGNDLYIGNSGAANALIQNNNGTLNITPSGGTTLHTGAANFTGDIEVRGNDLYVGNSGAANALLQNNNGTLNIVPSASAIAVTGSLSVTDTLSEITGHDEDALCQISLGNGTATLTTWDDPIQVWRFRPASNDDLAIICQLPHGWIEGGTLFPHVHWTNNIGALAAGNQVQWSLAYSLANIDAAFSTGGNKTTVTATYTAPGAVAQNTHIVTYVPAIGISGVGKTVSSILIAGLTRTNPGANNYGSNVGLISFDLHYKRGKFGKNV